MQFIPYISCYVTNNIEIASNNMQRKFTIRHGFNPREEQKETKESIMRSNKMQ